jgi:hypothetical protein
MSRYPQTAPIADAINAFNIIKAGEHATRAAELAESLWIVQGYAQKITIGDPSPVFGAAELSASDDQSLVALTDELAAFANVPQVFAADRERKVDWKRLFELLLKVAPIILPLLSEE